MDGCQGEGRAAGQTRNCIAEAARFVAADTGAAQRLIATHVAGPDDRCVACGRSVRWPCVLVMIARTAVQVDAGAVR